MLSSFVYVVVWWMVLFGWLGRLLSSLHLGETKGMGDGDGRAFKGGEEGDVDVDGRKRRGEKKEKIVEDRGFPNAIDLKKI